jgi:hypothetical protein
MQKEAASEHIEPVQDSAALILANTADPTKRAINCGILPVSIFTEAMMYPMPNILVGLTLFEATNIPRTSSARNAPIGIMVLA